jgi:DNA repair exonuclease SbcCD ATPase subunit
MIALKELELTNFRSWKHLHIKDFDKKGLCLIRGKNGSGKSSIRMAIEYLILDKTSDGISVEDIPRNSSSSCTIIGVFEIDSKPVTITKYRNHTKFSNKTVVDYDGDTSLTANDRRITQKNIEGLFDVTSDILFTSTIFTVNSPSFVESLEADRKKLLYNILPLSVYSELYLVATGKSKLIKNKLEKTAYSIEYKAESLTALKQETKELKKKEEYHRDEVEHQIKQLKLAREEFTYESTEDLKDKIKELKTTAKEVDRSMLNNAELALRELQKKYTDLNYDKKYVKSHLASITDGTCPLLQVTCDKLQESAAETVNKYEPELERVQAEIDGVDVEINSVSTEISAIRRDEEYNTNLEYKVRDCSQKITKIEYANKEINSHIEAINNKISSLKEDTNNPYSVIVKENTSKIKTLTTDINKLRKSVKELEKKLEYYLYFEKAFSKAGIPNMKSDGFLNSIETETNRYLSSVSDRMFVKVTSQTEVGSELREKIQYKVLHPDKAITSYKSYSGGEKQRVKVSDLFAFHSLISKFNFIFLDEVLEGSIDTKGKAEILALLKLKSKEVNSLLVVSHDSTIKDAFDNVMEIKNINGVSVLE